MVLNSAEELSVEDEALFKAIHGLNAVILLNKTDLDKKIDETVYENWHPAAPLLRRLY